LNQLDLMTVSMDSKSRDGRDRQGGYKTMFNDKK
jgi:hypothetical protein